MKIHQLTNHPHSHKLVELFIRHRYWYNQGSSAMASVSVLPLEKLAIGAAALKYLFGEHVSPVVLYSLLGIYFVWRLMSRWLIGWFWHHSDGYTAETKWNKGKVPPIRAEIINVDEVIEGVVKTLNKKET